MAKKSKKVLKLIAENKKLECMPDVGKAFVMYKKVHFPGSGRRTARSVILTLLVPAKAKRHSSGYRRDNKLRVSEAKVIEARERSGRLFQVKRGDRLESVHFNMFLYKIGKTVRPEKPFDLGPETCASGIHGFLSVTSARSY